METRKPIKKKSEPSFLGPAPLKTNNHFFLVADILSRSSTFVKHEIQTTKKPRSRNKKAAAVCDSSY
jgi:hypothetical protein